jgi:unspecific monooxygenase
MNAGSAEPGVFAPDDPAFVADPYPAYRSLRAGPRVVHHRATDQWIVSRHADVSRLLRDRRLGRSYLHVATHAEMRRPPEPDWVAPFWHVIRNGMLDREPPDHTRLRRLVSAAFTPRFVEGLRPRIQAIVDRLIDGLQERPEFDLVGELAEPLPVEVIAELLGIPLEDRSRLRPWSAEICGMYELNPDEPTQRRAVAAAVEFSGYLRELIRQRRTNPADDLISHMTAVAELDDHLTEDELIGTCVLLLNAGHEASVNATAIGWWTLFRHPEALDQLRREPSIAPSAVDEMLRFDTPLQMFERWVLEDLEIGNVRIPRGAELALLFGSANRDSNEFDEPDRLDLVREPNRHVSFGAGLHYCLGAPLARMELAISLETAVRRLPNMKPVADAEWKPGYIMRGVRELRVRP